MNLRLAAEGKEYTVERINSEDEELKSFLFTLGCYSGEPITLIKSRRSGCIITVKDGRYSIDKNLAEAIEVE